MLLGPTGLLLSCTAQNPARLVYGSAALVASLRGQQSHFATLPTNANTPFRAGGILNKLGVVASSQMHPYTNSAWYNLYTESPADMQGTTGEHYQVLRNDS